jgi:hypothetical protein
VGGRTSDPFAALDGNANHSRHARLRLPPGYALALGRPPGTPVVGPGAPGTSFFRHLKLHYNLHF